MSMPSAVRHINEVRVLDVVFRHGRVSRANIAKELEITRSTASSIVAGLAEEGLLIEDNSEDDKSAGTGRPGTFVRLNPHHAVFLGADVGVGRVTVVALDFAGNIMSSRHFPLSADDYPPEILLRALAGHVDSVIAPLLGTYEIKGLCVTVPGVIDRSGTVLRAPFLGWRNVPILESLGTLLPKIPLIVAENDANAFAIANGYQSTAPPSKAEIHIFLDAGIGGAIVTEGHLLRGQDGYAGEFGHMVLGEKGFVEVATLPGSFESFIGRDAILARHRMHGGVAGTIEAFRQKVAAAEPQALAAIADWSFYLGRGLAIISSIFNPSRIVLGGPVASLFALCEKEVKQAIRRNLLDDQPVPEMAVSALGLEGPALGGAFMLHRNALSLNQDLVFRPGQPASGRGQSRTAWF